jgi:hypothetical protein
VKIDVLLAIEEVQQGSWNSHQTCEVADTSCVDIETAQTAEPGPEVADAWIALTETDGPASESRKAAKECELSFVEH